MAKVAIATTTFYKSAKEIRFQLALRTVRAATKFGYLIAVVDGGSPDEVCKKFSDAGAYLFQQELPGMGPSRRQAIAAAAKLVNNDGAVVWMEPEKYTLVPQLYKAATPILNGVSDLVIPARKSMTSYPLEQQCAEFFGNLAFQHITGLALDAWFGPRVMNQRAINYFTTYKGEYGDKWDSIFIPVLRAFKAGLRVRSVKVNYTHPKKQAATETGLNFLVKRLDQLNNLIPAMAQEAKKIGLTPIK